MHRFNTKILVFEMNRSTVSRITAITGIKSATIHSILLDVQLWGVNAACAINMDPNSLGTEKTTGTNRIETQSVNTIRLTKAVTCNFLYIIYTHKFLYRSPMLHSHYGTD